MNKAERRFVSGVGTLVVSALAVAYFSKCCNWWNWLGYLMPSLSNTRCLSKVVAVAKPLSSCPQDGVIDVFVELESLGAKYLRQGNYRLAQQCFEKWVAELEKNPNSKRLELARALGNVGWSLQAQGKNWQAIPLLERSLVLFESDQSFDKQNLVFWTANLATAKQRVAAFEDAEKLLKRALSITKKEFGADSPEFASTLNNIGGYYLDVNKQDKAAESYREALAIDERALGPSSIAVGRDLCNLAESYREQGKLIKAEPLFKRALAISDKSRNAEAAFTCNNLGLLYASQGKYSLAEGLYQRALHIRIKILGARSPYVGLTLTNYATLLRKTNRVDEAVKLEERAIATYPFDQSQIVDAKIAKLDSKARQCFCVKDYPAAVRLYRDSLGLACERKPYSQIQVAEHMKSLALASLENGGYLEAELLLKQCIQIRESAASATGLELAGYFDILAFNYYSRGLYSDAEVWYLKTLAMEQSARMSDKSYLAQAFTNLGNVCLQQSKFYEAVSYYTRAQSLSEKELGPDNSNLPWILNNLAFCYQRQGNSLAAEPLYKRALKIRRQFRIFLYPSIETIEENYKSLLALR